MRGHTPRDSEPPQAARIAVVFQTYVPFPCFRTLLLELSWNRKAPRVSRASSHRSFGAQEKPRKGCFRIAHPQDTQGTLALRGAEPIGARSRNHITYSPHLFDMSKVPVGYSVTLCLYADRKRERPSPRTLSGLSKHIMPCYALQGKHTTQRDISSSGNQGPNRRKEPHPATPKLPTITLGPFVSFVPAHAIFL